jgi:hypothetical protein
LRILVINQLQVIFIKLVSNRLIIEINEGSFTRFVVNSNGTGSVLKRALYVCQLFDPHSIATIHVDFSSCFGCGLSDQFRLGVKADVKRCFKQTVYDQTGYSESIPGPNLLKVINQQETKL